MNNVDVGAALPISYVELVVWFTEEIATFSADSDCSCLRPVSFLPNLLYLLSVIFTAHYEESIDN